MNSGFAAFFIVLSFLMTPGSLEARKVNTKTEPKAIYGKFSFDYGVKGVFPVELMKADTTGGSMTVESDPENDSNQCVKLDKTADNPSKQLVMYKEFTPITEGRVTIEARIRISDLSNRKEFILLSNNSQEIAGIIFEQDGKITAVNNGSSYPVLVSDVKLNQWYTLELNLDLSAKNYLVSVNGKNVTPKPLAWKNKDSVAGRLEKMLFRSCGSRSAGTFYIDAIDIKVDKILGLVYNTGTDKATSTSKLQTGRVCPTLYYVSLPIGWTPDKKWPVFMFNIREGCDELPNACPQIFAEKRGKMPFIIISVKTKNIKGSDNGYSKNVLDYCKATSDQLFDEVAVIELFQQVKEDYSGEDKFYWDGCSAGGHSFWPLIMWRPEFIAAACGSACNYLGNGGPNPADLGRGMTSKGVSHAPERVNLPIKQYTGDQDQAAQIGVTSGKGMWQQFMNAKATCEAHGYRNISLEILPGEKHRLYFDKELAFFYNHYLSTHTLAK